MGAIACTLDQVSASAAQVAGRECTVGAFMATALSSAAAKSIVCLAALYGRPKSTERIVNVQERGVLGASPSHPGSTDPPPGVEDTQGRSSGTRGGPAAGAWRTRPGRPWLPQSGPRPGLSFLSHTPQNLVL